MLFKAFLSEWCMTRKHFVKLSLICNNDIHPQVEPGVVNILRCQRRKEKVCKFSELGVKGGRRAHYY